MHSWLAQQRPWLQRARRSAYFTVRSERVRQESHEDILDAVHGFTQLGLGHSIGSLVWWNGQDLSDLSWNGSRDQGPRRVPSHRSRCSQVPWTMCKVFLNFCCFSISDEGDQCCCVCLESSAGMFQYPFQFFKLEVCLKLFNSFQMPQ